MQRIDKENYYLDIAQTVLERSTCLRRWYGAIIVRNDEIVATGYNGAPRGRANCCELGYCVREQMQVPRGERYELCRSVHAEANAIISASRNECIGGTLYLRMTTRSSPALMMVRRHPLPGGAGRCHRQAPPRRHLLLHVPPYHHQRRARAGGHPPHRDGVHRRSRPGVD